MSAQLWRRVLQLTNYAKNASGISGMGASVARRRNSGTDLPPFFAFSFASTISEYLPPTTEPIMLPPPKAVVAYMVRPLDPVARRLLIGSHLARPILL